MSRLQREWHPTPHGEWYCAGVALVVAQYDAWYAYPLDGSPALGPYPSMLEAQLAAETANGADGERRAT